MKSEDTLGVTPFGYEYRVPFFPFVREFPWYTTSDLYWHIHHPLQLLAALAISLGYGDISRLSCVLFGMFQLIFVLRDMTAYNNHEYMYATLAVALSLCDGHTRRYSPLFMSSHDPSRSAASYLSLCLAVVSVSYMMLWNVVYGIPGAIGLCGMLAMWIAVLLALGESCKNTRNEKGGESSQCTDRTDTNTLPITSPPSPPPTVPRWNVLLLNIFLSTVYFYAGIAKLEEDWLNGYTPRELFSSWIGPSAITSVIQTAIHMEWPVFAVVYGGLCLDAFFAFAINSGLPIIRAICTSAAISFHLVNHFTFVIETFPWVMIAGMAIYFDHVWIEWTARHLEGIFLHPMVITSYEYMRNALRRYVVPVVAVVFLAIHVLLPLPCAIHAPFSRDLCWYSQCQFFSWRMMTRSVKMFALFINLQHPISRQIDSVMIENFKIDHTESATVASYEDYIHEVAMRIKISAETRHAVEFAPPIVTADIWFQVNGPPIQRFVDPAADLTAYPLQRAYDMNFLTYFNKPQPMASWVEPRIMEYRSQYWKDIMLAIQKQEAVRHAERGGSPQSEVMFFADRAGEGRILPLLLQEAMLFRVLAGSVTVSGYGIVQEGTCMEAKGTLIISPNAGNALWMVRDIGKKVMTVKRSAVMSQRLEVPVMKIVRCDSDRVGDKARVEKEQWRKHPRDL